MAEQSSKETSKRRVKNPDSFRERAIKSAESDDISKRSWLKSKLGLVFSPVFNALGKFFSQPVFKPLRVVLSFLGKILFPRYFRNSWLELKQVTWPTWKESQRLTFAVVIFAVIFGAVIAGVDWGLDKVFKSLLLK
jgi:preprotein translocase SecE subunit